MNLSQKFGKKIKIKRIMQDLTIEKLAELANLGTTTITTIERGVASPTLDTVEKLAKAFEIEPYELLMLEDIEKLIKKH